MAVVSPFIAFFTHGLLGAVSAPAEESTCRRHGKRSVLDAFLGHPSFKQLVNVPFV
jgi:hypothetical protein